MASESAFDDFVLARSQALLRTAYLLVQDEGKAEDLLQTALTKAWFAWSRIQDPEAYVRRIMVTTSASWWRRKWTGETPIADFPDRNGSPADAAPDVGQDLWDAIGRLPRRQRAIVVLRYVEDYTEVETAQLLDCSVGTIKSQSAKARAKLRIDNSLAPMTDERNQS